MSGLRRLAVFASVVWIAAIGLLSGMDLYVVDVYLTWVSWLAVGVAPVALVWGVAWAVAEFRGR